MADKKVSELVATTVIGDTDLFHIVETATVNKKIVGSNMKSELGAPDVTNTWIEPQLFESQNIVGENHRVIDIVASSAIPTDAHWVGLRVLGDNLDPSGVESRIRGIAVNLSNVDLTNNPDMEGIRVVMPCCAIGMDMVEGILLQHVTVPNTALASFTIHNIVIHTDDLAASSEVHALDVTAVGPVLGSVAAIATHAEISPIHQHVGVPAAPGANFACRETVGPVYTDNINGENIWVAANDGICIGAVAKFDEVLLDFTTPATKDEIFTFWYYDNTPQWVQFYPADDTNGGKHSGLIRWDKNQLTNWSSQDPCGAVGDTGYWIRITRTRVSNPGAVILNNAEFLSADLYEWDKDGNVTIHDLTALGTIILSGLPGADPHVLGQLWNNGNVVTVSAG